MSAQGIPPQAAMIPESQVQNYVAWLIMRTAQSDPVKAAELSMMRSVQQRLEVLEALAIVLILEIAAAAVFLKI